MLKSPAAAGKVKAKSIPPGFPSNSNTGTMPDFKSGNSNSKKNKAPLDSDGEEVPVTKKKKVELVFEDEMKANEGSNNTSNGGANNNAKSVKNKEAAMEAEVKAARERQLVPLEQRMKQFRDLLKEKEISAFSTWEKELHKIVFDPRYLLLTSKERKQVFDRYVRERADEERKEKKAKAKERKDAFRSLCEDK